MVAMAIVEDGGGVVLQLVPNEVTRRVEQPNVDPMAVLKTLPDDERLRVALDIIADLEDTMVRKLEWRKFVAEQLALLVTTTEQENEHGA